MDFQKVLYSQGVESPLNNGKDGKTRTQVYVTEEMNCVLIWRQDTTWEYPHDDCAGSDQAILKFFRKYEKTDAIEYAVDWIRNQKKT